MKRILAQMIKKISAKDEDIVTCHESQIWDLERWIDELAARQAKLSNRIWAILMK